MKKKQKEKLEELCEKQRDAVDALSTTSMQMLACMGAKDEHVSRLDTKKIAAVKVAEKMFNRLQDKIKGVFKGDEVCSQMAFDIALLSVVQEWSEKRRQRIKEVIEEVYKDEDVSGIKKRLGIKD